MFKLYLTLKVYEGRSTTSDFSEGRGESTYLITTEDSVEMTESLVLSTDVYISSNFPLRSS